MSTQPLGLRFLRNPLVVFGAVLLAGDGPLLAAIALLEDAAQVWCALISLIVLVFGMAAFFCYLVGWRTRRLYGPGEIPAEAIGKSLFDDGPQSQHLAIELEEIDKRTDAKVDRVKEELLGRLATLTKTETPTQDALSQVVQRAINETREAEKQAFSSKQIAASAEQIINFLENCGGSAKGSDVVRNLARLGSNPAAVVSALRRLEKRGHIIKDRGAQDSEVECMYRINPKAHMGRVTDRKWDGTHWWYRLDGKDEWRREDWLRALLSEEHPSDSI